MNVELTCCFQSNLFALNPGGTQLSSDEIPLPLIYTVINLIWATLMAAWFFNWVIYFKVGTSIYEGWFKLIALKYLALIYIEL